MSSTQNNELIFPTFIHLKAKVQKANSIDALNLIVRQLMRRDTWKVHRFSEDEEDEAWELLERRAKAIDPSAYALGNGEFRVPKT